MTAPATDTHDATATYLSQPVTAVVPTHNRPALMRRAVQSIVDQDYPGDIEIVVVFDGCEPVLPELYLPANRSLRAVINTRSRGLAGARNTGILEAGAEFVAFLDDDDHWLFSKLSEQMAIFDAYPDVVLVGSAMRVDDGALVQERLVPSSTIHYDDLLRSRLTGLHASSFVFRTRALIDDLGMVDEDLPGSFGEDYDLLLKAAKVAPIMLVNRPLVQVSWKEQSYFFGKWNEYAEGLQYLLAKHPEFSDDRRSLARIHAQLAFAYCASGQRRKGRSYALKSLRRVPTRAKAYAALAVSFHLVSSTRVISMAHRLGKAI
ncbi:glycosyltransferase [soil metagenome]